MYLLRMCFTYCIGVSSDKVCFFPLTTVTVLRYSAVCIGTHTYIYMYTHTCIVACCSDASLKDSNGRKGAALYAMLVATVVLLFFARNERKMGGRRALCVSKFAHTTLIS